jgi:hypothetical protein
MGCGVRVGPGGRPAEKYTAGRQAVPAGVGGGLFKDGHLSNKHTEHCYNPSSCARLYAPITSSYFSGNVVKNPEVSKFFRLMTIRNFRK